MRARPPSKNLKEDWRKFIVRGAVREAVFDSAKVHFFLRACRIGWCAWGVVENFDEEGCYNTYVGRTRCGGHAADGICRVLIVQLAEGATEFDEGGGNRCAYELIERHCRRGVERRTQRHRIELFLGAQQANLELRARALQRRRRRGNVIGELPTVEHAILVPELLELLLPADGYDLDHQPYIKPALEKATLAQRGREALAVRRVTPADFRTRRQVVVPSVRRAISQLLDCRRNI
mmetsp:Transcript_25916/g.71465  ORF Transcript_25916/g.71465 Transcript_25916/m.71465 type:complete len:235 (+) Transcript_25916:850-1554(+)|eukprot:scaffold40574_cov27-Tisochrysis_lutea.AAC.1